MKRNLIMFVALIAADAVSWFVWGKCNPLDIALGFVAGMIVNELLRKSEDDGREDRN